MWSPWQKFEHNSNWFIMIIHHFLCSLFESSPSSVAKICRKNGGQQWLKWSREAEGLTWRSHDGANPIPIPHLTNLALFRHKITLYRFNQGAHTIAGGGLKSEQGGWAPHQPPTHFNHWRSGSVRSSHQTVLGASKIVLPSIVWHKSFILDKLAELSNNIFEWKDVTFKGVRAYSDLSYIFSGGGQDLQLPGSTPPVSIRYTAVVVEMWEVTEQRNGPLGLCDDDDDRWWRYREDNSDLPFGAANLGFNYLR